MTNNVNVENSNDLLSMINENRNEVVIREEEIDFEIVTDFIREKSIIDQLQPEIAESIEAFNSFFVDVDDDDLLNAIFENCVTDNPNPNSQKPDQTTVETIQNQVITVNQSPITSKNIQNQSISNEITLPKSRIQIYDPNHSCQQNSDQVITHQIALQSQINNTNFCLVSGNGVNNLIPVNLVSNNPNLQQNGGDVASQKITKRTTTTRRRRKRDQIAPTSVKLRPIAPKLPAHIPVNWIVVPGLGPVANFNRDLLVVHRS